MTTILISTLCIFFYLYDILINIYDWSILYNVNNILIYKRFDVLREF